MKISEGCRAYICCLLIMTVRVCSFPFKCFTEPGVLLYTIQLSDSSMPPLDRHHRITQSTGSNEGLELAKKWLDECVNTHKDCRAEYSNFYPERLISLEPGALRIMVSSELSERPNYATLSHCWGTMPYLKLQKSNYDQLRIKVPYDQLSKTFMDAIKVARACGLHYLWIDSLCIIQDSLEDWEQKSVKMVDVYGCSTMNISATGAKDGSVGCFFDRNAQDVKNISAPVVAEVRQKNYSIVCTSISLYESAMGNAPLLSRGWCFQERFLSPRALHFTASQLFWECECLQA